MTRLLLMMIYQLVKSGQKFAVGTVVDGSADIVIGAVTAAAVGLFFTGLLAAGIIATAPVAAIIGATLFVSAGLGYLFTSTGADKAIKTWVSNLFYGKVKKMMFSQIYEKSALQYVVFVTILAGTFPLLSTLMNSELFFQVIPYLIGIISICLAIGIANQLWLKSGYFLALSWIFNPMIWFLYGVGSIWYIRVIGADWFWWLVYPGIYLLFFIIQIIFAKWWQSHDALIVKISIWVMLITPLLTGGRYGRYSVRYVGSQTIQVFNNPIQIVDLTMLLLSTIGGLGIILFSGRNLWQRVGEFEEEKRQLIENKL